MKYLIFIFIFLAQFTFSQEVIQKQDKKTDQTIPEDPLIKKADITVNCNYRAKTSRSLQDTDIPQLNYTTMFYIGNDFTFNIDYGNQPFKQTEQRKIDAKMFISTIDFLEPLSESFALSSSLSYTYYTDLGSPSEYSAFAALICKFWRFTTRAQLLYLFYDSSSYNNIHLDSKEEIVPGVFAELNLGFGLFINDLFNYSSTYYLNPDSKEEQFKYFKNTVSFGFKHQFKQYGLNVLVKYSVDTALKSKNSYPFNLEENSIPLKIFYTNITKDLSQKGDISLSFNFKNIKSKFFEDFYLGFSLNISLNS